jgi:hypothetical protein
VPPLFTRGGGHLSRTQKGKSFTAITIRRYNGYEVIRAIRPVYGKAEMISDGVISRAITIRRDNGYEVPRAIISEAITAPI